MKNIDGNVKLSPMQIIFSPLLALWNMASSEPDITDEIELNPNSSDRTEAYLASNQDKVDEMVEKYATRGKAKKQIGIKGIEVDTERLTNHVPEQTVAKEINTMDHERAD